MVSKLYQECLIDIYRGEQEGEAIFDAVLRSAEDDKQKYVIGSFLQLETEGKARLRPMMSKLGISTAEDAKAKADAAALVESMAHMPWKDQFAAMAAGIEAEFLAKYRELATLVTEEEDAEAYRLATFMGDHEYAIMVATANLAADKPNPIAPVVDLLQFPLLKPANYGEGPVWDEG
ncbi:MAG: hypothetical protein AAGL90_15925 [Pseudomonadota bacterium]